MELERLCYITEGLGSRNASPDTGSGFMIILGACELRRQTYCLRHCEAIYEESAATRATPRRSVLLLFPESIALR